MKTWVLLVAFYMILNCVRLKSLEKDSSFMLLFFSSLFLLLLNFHNIAQLEAATQSFQWTLIFFLAVFIGIHLQIRLFHQDNTHIWVILGCGLLEGNRISPMLMRRCDVAIKKAGAKDIFVVSGGKGKDEKISEASAMKKYLMEQKIQENQIMMEECSRNTKENLLFSSSLIGDRFEVVSSDYHMLRIYLLSKKMKLKLNFHASKSVAYYRLYAWLREYGAFLIMYRKAVVLIWLLILMIL